MKCPQCNRDTEAGAFYCGNCGYQLMAPQQPATQPTPAVQSGAPVSPFAQVVANQAPDTQAAAAATVPGYALPATPAGALPQYAIPVHHPGDTQAVLSLVFGVMAAVCAFILPVLIAIILGVTGIVLGTMSRRSPKKILSTIGMVLSAIAILVGFGAIAFYSTHKLAATGGANPAVHAVGRDTSIDTPCYSIAFTKTGPLTATQQGVTCTMSAFDGSTANLSANRYAINSVTVPGETEANLVSDAKQPLESNLTKYFPDATLTSEGRETFAGSPAYSVYASNGKMAVVQTAVLHASGGGDNVFIIVRAGASNHVDLKDLEAGWQWK